MYTLRILTLAGNRPLMRQPDSNRREAGRLMMSKNLTWDELIVTDCDGNEIGTLGELYYSEDASEIDIGEDGSICSWPGYFISAPGEDPDWDTPRGPVDWTGFC